MAKQGKGKTDGNGADEHELVTMARGLAEIVEAHGLTELIVDTKETTLTVRRGGTSAVAMPMQQMQAPMQMALPQAASVVHAPAAPAIVVDEKAHVVTSPFVGTFYRKPNPDSPNYVSINDKVEKGAVLCIVEAMKLMNEIEADVAGTITGILVEDGAPVEYGQPLFKIAT
ncbi:MAG: acetyl-CoA carboxylase, biotin carboxyl carrier protein [Myxococcales bacterium]|nr:acetyl-CoA carboxylase, biotin carboxyl carrier protein [Myxococcales bacterium]